MTVIHGGDVWPAITKACRTRGPRRAAIAYVGADAPRLLPLKRGDQLVVNASTAALLAHATSPVALERFLAVGVQVWSSPSLHAKVVVTSTTAVVGSANASANSQTLKEAVVVATTAALRRQAVDFIDAIDDLTPVNNEFIAAASKLWKRGRGGGRPGVDGAGQDRPFLPTPPLRLHVAAGSEWWDWDDKDREVFDRSWRRVRRAAGPAARYSLDSYKHEAGVKPYRVGDVVVAVTTDDGVRMVSPPQVVMSEPIPVGRRRYTMQILRGRTDLEPKTVAEVEAAWKAARRAGRFDRERWLKDPSDRRAVLLVWDLAEA